MKKPISRVAAIHDMSGFGKTSLTVVIPILSTMGFQVCPIPTAILSTHTGGFNNPVFVDFTEHMESYIEHWKSLEISFDCIYSGFLGSAKQIDLITNFIKDFSEDDQLVVIDPVLGDNGKLYKTMSYEMVEKMRKFISLANIITPNFTEACLLLNEEYKENIEIEELKKWLRHLSEMGPEKVVITSVPSEKSVDNTSVIAYDSVDNRFWKIRCDYIPAHFPGTGDTFASILVGSMLQGDSLPIAIDRATQFITLGIRASYGHKYPEREGILLERVLDNLKAPVTISSYEIL